MKSLDYLLIENTAQTKLIFQKCFTEGILKKFMIFRNNIFWGYFNDSMKSHFFLLCA